MTNRRTIGGGGSALGAALALVLALSAGPVIVGRAPAQVPSPNPASVGRSAPPPATNLATGTSGSGLSVEALEGRLAEARAQLAAALGDGSLTNAPIGVSPQDIWVRRTALLRLVRIYEQQLSNVAELETTRTRTAEIVR